RAIVANITAGDGTIDNKDTSSRGSSNGDGSTTTTTVSGMGNDGGKRKKRIREHNYSRLRTAPVLHAWEKYMTLTLTELGTLCDEYTKTRRYQTHVDTNIDASSLYSVDKHHPCHLSSWMDVESMFRNRDYDTVYEQTGKAYQNHGCLYTNYMRKSVLVGYDEYDLPIYEEDVLLWFKPPGATFFNIPLDWLCPSQFIYKYLPNTQQSNRNILSLLYPTVFGDSATALRRHTERVQLAQEINTTEWGYYGARRTLESYRYNDTSAVALISAHVDIEFMSKNVFVRKYCDHWYRQAEAVLPFPEKLQTKSTEQTGIMDRPTALKIPKIGLYRIYPEEIEALLFIAVKKVLDTDMYVKWDGKDEVTLAREFLEKGCNPHLSIDNLDDDGNPINPFVSISLHVRRAIVLLLPNTRVAEKMRSFLCAEDPQMIVETTSAQWFVKNGGAAYQQNHIS
ncbi:hypothetical protein KDA14_05455, partial [Candidatus Saccharibacteria bacterium]|nr:hypothetical protein [Candidatus Saccharibacteria bacterium]